jgi:hypothetical protein
VNKTVLPACAACAITDQVGELVAANGRYVSDQAQPKDRTVGGLTPGAWGLGPGPMSRLYSSKGRSTSSPSSPLAFRPPLPFVG